MTRSAVRSDGRRGKRATKLPDEKGADAFSPYFQVMPPPKISGRDELWRVADAGALWSCVAIALEDVPAAVELLTPLKTDLGMCFCFLERTLRTGRIAESKDSRLELADEMIDVAHAMLEMDARGELSQHDGLVGDAALALLASAREACELAGRHPDAGFHPAKSADSAKGAEVRP